MKLGRKRKVQELGRLILIIAGKGTAFKKKLEGIIVSRPGC